MILDAKPLYERGGIFACEESLEFRRLRDREEAQWLQKAGPNLLLAVRAMCSNGFFI